MYSPCSTLGVGCYLYANPGLTVPYSSYFLTDGTNCYETDASGQITNESVCPSPTPTPTETPTNTPTPTETQTAPPTYTVDLYAAHGYSQSPNAIDIHWSDDDITYTFAATLGVTTTCTQLFPSPSIDITGGGTLYIRIQDASLVSYIYFNANDGTANNCPGNSQTYCTYSFVVNSNTVVNVTAYNDTSTGDFSYCS